MDFNGFSFTQLFQPPILNQLDQQFLNCLRQQQETELAEQLLTYRQQEHHFSALEISTLLLACAPILENFIAQIFQIEAEVTAARAQAQTHQSLFAFKKWFVLRRARRRLSKEQPTASFAQLDAWLTQALAAQSTTDREYAVAAFSQQLLTDKARYANEIEQLTQWCMAALTTLEGQTAVHNWASFRLPHHLDHQHLVPIAGNSEHGFTAPAGQRRQRQDFQLTDPGMSARQVHSELHYCLECHQQEGDFCSKGFPQKRTEPQQGFKLDPLGNLLTGCPLDEKISEMHQLKRQGYTIAALALVMIDNPLCPVTGHRICNDCMKSCIYQRQDPVNIPQIETRILLDVLALPWGVEIYDLLTRWHPLRPQQWVAKPYNGLKVLIAGQGPAGFSLAHHLLMEGFAVVGIDGLKIEPLPEAWLQHPIKDYATLTEPLAARVVYGFGGVAEYGITVRWDKNFLKLIHLSLLRRPYYQLMGSVRFGGTLTVADAWQLGFDHVSIAVGAGLPKALAIPGSLAPGMRQAADFLMALQLTGAAKSNSLTNMQVRLPAVIIGGGLTAIDTATEVQAYYLVQIEKFLQRYEQLSEVWGEARVRAHFDVQSLEVLSEWLTHARQLRAAQQQAKAQGHPLDIHNLIHQWGGVTIVYRRSLQESPAYIRNHEEVAKALEEGIFYRPGLEPQAVQRDDFGHVQALVCTQRQRAPDGQWQSTEHTVRLAARAIFVATGAQPNIAYEFEHRGHFQRQGFQYQPHEFRDGQLQPLAFAPHCKAAELGVFTSYAQNGHYVSFIGDTHATFQGSVVKALASGKRTYPQIVALFAKQVHAQGDEEAYFNFRTQIQEQLSTRVVQVQRHSPSAIEVQLKSPLAARKFQPGQFFRLQNFETHAPLLGNTRLQTEALAMRCAAVAPEAGLI
ncbi:MAG: FAD-dependent oxidoreductase, partial [Pseudomonadota bacterium]|nr:FAD-dependent oxidoreductase [Pseudomonadota bacterium]